VGMRVNLKPGIIGTATIETFEVSEEDARMENMRASFRGGRYIDAGKYTRLFIKGVGLVMSDVPAEQNDHRSPVNKARGSVLINGLGIGMVVSACLKNPQVTDVTVVEINKDVIDLVGPQIADPRLTIIHADAFEYQPPKGKMYEVVWHDIWPHICADNLPEMTRLRRKYGRRAEWQGCWCEYQCKQAQRRYA